MDRKELIKKYMEFFKSKNHKQIRNFPLIPENDPTVLFTTAGMHPIVPFLLGEEHPQGKRITNVQRCIRTGDIEEVGDATHHTLFEMLGNWSLGDYFKKEAIELSFEFLTKVLKISQERISVTCFKGDKDAPKDKESSDIWKSLGIKKIGFLGKKDNWWGPAGKTGPCGPDTEMFVDGIEIWNDVFMQYNKDGKGNYNEAKQKNIDTGMGVERTIAVLGGLEDNYLASMWKPVIEKVERISEEKYGSDEEITKSMRIIVDHIKAAVFIIHDGIVPGNSEQGYVLRRLIRRAIRYGRSIGIEMFTTKIADVIYEIYDDYKFDKKKISLELQKEEEKFIGRLEKGLRVFERLAKNAKEIKGNDAFLLYQSYGFPIEMTRELAKEKKVKLDEEGFKKESEKHQKLSQTASAGKFKSGLADDSEATKKLHTACHLLNEVLRMVLDKPDLSQRGSNITPERLRFDFNFDRKLTPEEIQDVEDMVNLKIKSNLPITCDIMSLKKAKEEGAGGVFDDKYGEDVKVYRIGAISKEFSKEICAGPHVNNTSELGKLKIVKEGSSSSGVRRIKAILE
jgi:alanyl-tRNA synthetase